MGSLNFNSVDLLSVCCMALSYVTDGSAIGLSVTDAWAEPLAVIGTFSAQLGPESSDAKAPTFAGNASACGALIRQLPR
jgi:hypothetical protein